MPELPEVEILVRHLAPLLVGRRIRDVDVRRPRIVRPDSPEALAGALRGRRIVGVRRRAKFLLFDLGGGRGTGRGEPAGRAGLLLGHLGMTGRMYVQPAARPLPRHAAVVLSLGREVWVFEDPRAFGRLTLDREVVEGLGPEPLERAFSVDWLGGALGRSAQPVKVRLLDQAVVAGLGNIYASEALHRAGLSPRRRSCSLRPRELQRLHGAVREVLDEAIRFGSTVPLDFAGSSGGGGDGLFYYGGGEGAAGYEERLRVYDRAGEPCGRCGRRLRRIVQAGRSTYFCPGCQA